jgi:undecaprenyl-diphosphatase
MTWLHTVVLSVIEGLTEFLPISSTGHMALASAFMGIEKSDFTKLFIENIQFGTILSVIVVYWRKFIDFRSWHFYLKLLYALIPSAVVGLLLKSYIDNAIQTPLVVAFTMFGGGFVLLFVDKWFKNPTIEKEEEIPNKKAWIIGFYQILSVVLPGLSRSGATIIGGMQQKLTRKAAAEFSFFLGVPTLAGAFVVSLWDAYRKTPEILTHHNIIVLAAGNFIGFVVAIFAIKGFIAYLTKHGFKFFGYYRIVFGFIIIVLLLMHVHVDF